MVYKDRQRRIWLTIKLVLDALIAMGAFLAAFAYRFEMSLAHPLDIIDSGAFGPYRSIFMLAPVIRIVSGFMTGLYEPRKGFKKSDALIAVSKAATLGSLVIVVLLFSYRGFFTYREYSYSRLVVVVDWAVNLLLLSGSRVLIGYVDAWLRGSGIGLKKVLFVGYNDEVARMAGEMASHGSGCAVAGYVGEERDGARLPYIGPKGALLAALQEKAIDEVYVLDSHVTQEELLRLSGWCDKLDTDLRIVPSLYMVMTQDAEVDEIAGIPTILVKKGGIRGWDRLLKEAEDYLISILLLVVLSPLMLLVAALILLDSKGPVFFRQERVGKNGKRFMIYKFRSMVEDADRVKRDLMGINEAQGPIFKIKNDPRVTRAGRFIRRTSIDELPQIINVIRGEMSLVGPRPPVPDEVAQYEEWQKERLAAQPGITGLWQVSGRDALSFDEMVKRDIYYIRNWSLWLDLGILIRTIPVVVLRKGAY